MDKTGDIDPSLARAARAAPGLNDLSLLDWMGHARPLLLPGVRFNLANHPYLTEIYASKARELVLCKAAQMGLSEYGISYALHACDQRRATVLYLFSTDTAVSDFSTARIGPAIEASPYLQSIIVTARGGVSPSDGRPSKSGADRVTLKRIRDNFLYLRGGRVAPDGSAPQLRSIPADVIVLDELDEMDPRAPALAEKRLGHSLIKERRDISTPTYSGMGIHARYLQSDMREWHVTCGNCGLSQPLNLDNLITSYDQLGRPVRWHTAEDGLTPVLKCAGCAVTLNRLGPGHWRATHPDRTIAGYKVTKLFSAQYELDELITSLQSTDENKRQQTFNQDLAEPYTPRGGQLTSEILDKCALTPTLSLTPNPSPGGRGEQMQYSHEFTAIVFENPAL